MLSLLSALQGNKHDSPPSQFYLRSKWATEGVVELQGKGCPLQRAQEQKSSVRLFNFLTISWRVMMLYSKSTGTPEPQQNSSSPQPLAYCKLTVTTTLPSLTISTQGFLVYIPVFFKTFELHSPVWQTWEYLRQDILETCRSMYLHAADLHPFSSFNICMFYSVL